MGHAKSARVHRPSESLPPTPPQPDRRTPPNQPTPPPDLPPTPQPAHPPHRPTTSPATPSVTSRHPSTLHSPTAHRSPTATSLLRPNQLHTTPDRPTHTPATTTPGQPPSGPHRYLPPAVQTAPVPAIAHSPHRPHIPRPHIPRPHFTTPRSEQPARRHPPARHLQGLTLAPTEAPNCDFPPPPHRKSPAPARRSPHRTLAHPHTAGPRRTLPHPHTASPRTPAQQTRVPHPAHIPHAAGLRRLDLALDVDGGVSERRGPRLATRGPGGQPGGRC